MLQWLAVNLFLLVITLAGAGTFFVLGVVVKELHLDNDVEPYLLAVVAVTSIFASYYSGKLMHDLADGRYRRNH